MGDRWQPNHAGAIAAKFTGSARQRCFIHKIDNVLGYVTTAKQRDQGEPELKAIFYQKSRQEANQAVEAFIEKYQKIYPTAVSCLQRDLEACLTFYSFPQEHWKTIRTNNNVSERLFEKVKRRSRLLGSGFSQQRQLCAAHLRRHSLFEVS